MQLVFYWAPKLARKCESKHWFSFGADGRSYGHVITKFSRMGRLPHFLSNGSTPTLGASPLAELRYEENPGESTLVRVSARFELARVRVIKNQL